MRPILRSLVDALDVLEWLCAWAAALLIPYIMITISADVVGRYLLDRPIGWAIELAEYALMAIPFLSMAWLVRHNGHVRIDLLLTALGARWRSRLNVLTNLLAAATCGIAAYYAVLTTISQYQRGVTTIGIYPVDKYILIAVVAFGLSLAFIEFMRAAGRALAEPAG